MAGTAASIEASRVDLEFHERVQSRIESGRARPDEVENAHAMLLAQVRLLQNMLDAGRREFYPGFCGEPYDWEQPRATLEEAVEDSKSGEAFDRFVTGYRQVAGP